MEDFQKQNELKITEIYEDRVLTRNERNEYGEWERVQREFRYQRKVNTLSTGLRFVNYFIDVLIVIQIPQVLALIYLQEAIFDYYIWFFILPPIYYVICETFFQRTVGKFFTKSIVVDAYGNPPDFRTIVVRTIIRFIPFEPLSFLNSDRGWHDTWTETYVLTKEELHTIRELQKDPENLQP